MAKRTTGRKTAAGKAGRKRQAAKKATKKAAKKLARKSTKKSAKKATKKSARKSAKKSAQRPGKAKTAAKKPARKAAKKAAKKGANKLPRKAAGKKQGTAGQPAPATPRAAKAAASANAPLKSASRAAVLPARKPLVTSITRKTARSRLAQRLKPEAKPPARKIALRTSVAHSSSARERPGRRPPAQFETQGFDLSALGFRTASRLDWPAIANLLIEAFDGPKEKGIVERLRESGDMVVEYVAEYVGEIVAHIGFCALGTDAGDPALKLAALVPLAVAGELEGHGIGTRLVALGLEALRGEGFSGVLVLGDPDFYGRCGFSTEAAARFDSSFAGPHLQALIFEPGALNEACAKLVWPEILTDQ